ncbi:MAG: hypothetical protein EXR72_20430 [Myxococcales bacterium]|nr:hypothetical protein [Myxococcales bacterium]
MLAKDSDYDLLVVRDVPDRGQRTSDVRRLLRGLGVPFVIVVYTPAEWKEWRNHPQSLALQIAQSGKVLLDAT